MRQESFGLKKLRGGLPSLHSVRPQTGVSKLRLPHPHLHLLPTPFQSLLVGIEKQIQFVAFDGPSPVFDPAPTVSRNIHDRPHGEIAGIRRQGTPLSHSGYPPPGYPVEPFYRKRSSPPLFVCLCWVPKKRPACLTATSYASSRSRSRIRSIR